MYVHANPAAAEGDTLDLQSQALFPTLLAKQSDPATSPHDTVPRQFVSPLQRPDGLTGRARESGCIGDLTVRDDLAAGNPGDHRSKPCQAG